MKKISCIIVEDELLARKSLEQLCNKSEHLELVESVESAILAQPIIENSNLDLILLDIDMPGMSGLELLEALPILPQIIFTTSNKEYAYDAFEYDVTDFLKKPITQPRFFKSIEKVVERSNQLNTIANASSLNEIYVKSDKRYVRVPFDDILYFENLGDYVKVNTTTTSHTIYGSLKSIAERIKHPRFLKIHRSFIINLSKVVDIEDNTLVIGKKVIPISRAHKPILMKSLNIL